MTAPRWTPDTTVLLQLRLLPGVGDLVLARLLSRARSPDEFVAAAWSASTRWARARGRPPADRARIGREAEAVRIRCHELGVRIVGRGDEAYPEALESLADPPLVLFLEGDRSLLDRPIVAVVGARKATAYGRRMADLLGRELVESGFVVLSGLALGIDGAAHRAALEAGGATIAVLGSGPDVPHPRSHRGLFAWIGREGLLVTEFPPGTPPLAHHFPRRNRILAALAEAVVVVEAARGSGAIITANRALDLGREVLAVPGLAEDPRIRGNLDLFRDGAKVACGAPDVLRALGRPGPAPPGGAGGPQEAPVPSGGEVGSPEGALLLSLLAERGPQPVDVVIRASGLPASEALAALAVLEVEGRVVSRPGRVVALARRSGRSLSAGSGG